jgi:hypothetical protein
MGVRVVRVVRVVREVGVRPVRGPRHGKHRVGRCTEVMVVPGTRDRGNSGNALWGCGRLGIAIDGPSTSQRSMETRGRLSHSRAITHPYATPSPPSPSEG